MAFSYQEHTTANGTSYSYSFDAVSHDTSNIKVTIGGKHLYDGVSKYDTTTRLLDETGSVQSAEYTITGTSSGGTLTINSNVNITGTVTNGVPTLSASQVMRIFRLTNRTTAEVSFSSDSVLTDTDLNKSSNQSRFLSLEAVDRSDESISIDSNDPTQYNVQISGNDKRIFGVATPVNQNDAVNKGYIDQNGNVSTVAGLNDEIARLGTSAMATATTGHIPVLANVVEQTVNYTVTVADNSGNKFHIQGGEYGSATSNPALTLIRGYTYVFDTSDSSLDPSGTSHPLIFKNGNTTLGSSDGVTTTGTLGTSGSKVTVVVSDSVAITKYTCTTHGDSMGNTITLRHDDLKEVADNNTNVTTVAGEISPTNNIATVAGANTNIGIVAGQISPTNNINTVAGLNTEITEVAGKSTEIDVLVNKYDGSTTATSGTNKNITQVDTVADSISSVNSVATNISQVTTFADTYHTAGTTEPSGSNVTEGDLWFDTANDVLKVYDGSSWASASSSIATVASQNEFTASDGQGTDSKYFALNHDVGLELVFLNGVRLKRGSDYYCTNSNTSTTPIASGNSATFVRLETVPGSSDILSVMAFGQIGNNLAVNVAGGTFTGGVTFEAGTTHNTGNNTFTLPTTRGSDTYVLTRDDSVGTGGTTWKESSVAPTIASIKYSNQTSGTFVENSGQTATDPAGGDLCQLTGNDFDSTAGGNASNVTITIDGTAATSVSVNSAKTEVTFAPPAKSAGSYTLTATNASGLSATTTISYDANPTWVTGANADLGDFIDGQITGTNGPQIIASEDGSNLTTGYKQVTSNTDNTIITSGVAGLTIGDNGYLTGTLAGTNGATNNFYAVAHDNEGQQSAIRQFHFVSYDYAASGGQNSLNNSGATIRYHVFTNTGTSVFQVIPSSLTVDIFLVAGGGAGPRSGGGGGGAGEVVWKTGLQLSAGSYNVVVGAGGPGDQETGSGRPANGTDTTFALGVSGKEVKAKGGGTGGVNSSGLRSGMSGGSGGGSSRDGTADSGYSQATGSKYGTGSASDQQGIGYVNAGGVAQGNSWASASGGGGAGGAGGNGSGNGTHASPHYGDGGSGGAGGVGIRGLDIHSDVTALMNDTSIGVLHGSDRYIAGGGGGAMQHYDSNSPSSRTGGAGGYGGGGAGVKNTASGTTMAGHGTPNTGGGGGGGLFGSTATNGGSGIVVIRYAI